MQDLYDPPVWKETCPSTRPVGFKLLSTNIHPVDESIRKALKVNKLQGSCCVPDPDHLFQWEVDRKRHSEEDQRVCPRQRYGSNGILFQPVCQNKCWQRTFLRTWNFVFQFISNSYVHFSVLCIGSAGLVRWRQKTTWLGSGKDRPRAVNLILWLPPTWQLS